MEKQKLSIWLSENLGSHDIMLSEVFRQRLLEATGCDAQWNTYSYEEMLEQVKARGLGGHLKPTEQRLTDALDILDALVAQYVPGDHGCPYRGRGSQFRHALGVLKAAGL
jgi:hypothetical protein